MIETKRLTVIPGGPVGGPRKGRSAVTLYCVLFLDRYSNRELVSVYSDWANAEAFRNSSPRKLYIEPEEVRGLDADGTLWCSNEWGPGGVLSFIKLHRTYDEAMYASDGRGKPTPVRVSDLGMIYDS